MSAPPSSPLPAPLLNASVQSDWIDYNGHMNDAYYAVVFSRSVDRLMAALGFETFERTQKSLTLYTVSLMVHYLREAHLSEALAVHGRILEHDSKRLRLWLSMRRENGEEIAQSEQLLLCVDQSEGKPRATNFPPLVWERLSAAVVPADKAPWPENAGRGVRLRKS